MITDQGEVKIMDFDLAKLSGQTKLTKTGSTLGTVMYMSPEQARGKALRAKMGDIDSQCEVIYIRSAKGRKDRYTLLSEILLDKFREYYKLYRPREYLFQGGNSRRHLSERSVQNVFQQLVGRTGIRKKVRVHAFQYSLVTH